MIEFYNEHDITDTDDAQLRDLLLLCFPMLTSFKTSRYWQEPCDYRWVIRDNGRIIANAAIHDKVFVADGQQIPIAGVAYVCVHPEYRGRGLAKQMLVEVHRWAAARHYAFTFLFGNKEIYQSSGYIPCENEFRILNLQANKPEIKRSDKAHYVPLKEERWPQSLVDIQGPVF